MSKKKMGNVGDVIWLYWGDAVGPAEAVWMPVECVPRDPMLCLTAGIHIGETKDTITLGLSIHGEPEMVDGAITIPKHNVQAYGTLVNIFHVLDEKDAA